MFYGDQLVHLGTTKPSDKAPTATLTTDHGYFSTSAAPEARKARAEKKERFKEEFDKKRQKEEERVKRKLTYEEEAKVKIEVKEALEWAEMSPTERKIHKLLADYDADNNTKLSYSEFKGILMACGLARNESKKFDEKKADRLFAYVDANGDGQLIVSELVQWILHGTADAAVMAHMNRPIDAKEAADAFKDFINDLARVSVIATEPEELAGKCFIRDRDKTKAARKAGIDVAKVKTRDLLPEERWLPFDEIFDEMDANDNGFISMTELVNALQTYGFDCHRKVIESMFRLLDENEDQRAKKFGSQSVTKRITKRLKDHALDMVEFLELFGKEIGKEELEKMPEEVQEHEAERKDLCKPPAADVAPESQEAAGGSAQ
eukprot:TRINITY_DN94850_c0_g1_i1.p1 TRINITY_DN94850_c0_g1~~TRINITY_DN94850_c0_g1_i1.p1  ORF type:complete len:396 (+),score=114.12 TRINITY_DN94850_c0_g1_i1:60-1190(+)